MEFDIFKILTEGQLYIDVGMSRDIKAFFEHNKDIRTYDIKVNENKKILIRMKLNNFSYNSAKDIFMRFVSFVGYRYLNLFVCEDLKNQVKYLYFTAMQNCEGTLMELLIS